MTDSVISIIAALIGQSLARCSRSGIPLEEFYRALRDERTADPDVTAEEMHGRALAWLEGKTWPA